MKNNQNRKMKTQTQSVMRSNDNNKIAANTHTKLRQMAIYHR